MDKPREGIAKNKLIRRIIMGVVALAAIGSLVWGALALVNSEC